MRGNRSFKRFNKKKIFTIKMLSWIRNMAKVKVSKYVIFFGGCIKQVAVQLYFLHFFSLASINDKGKGGRDVKSGDFTMQQDLLVEHSIQTSLEVYLIVEVCLTMHFLRSNLLLCESLQQPLAESPHSPCCYL